MSSLSQLSESVVFHVSLNVSSLDRSVEFFSKVFDAAPVKHRPDYAKFELRHPPLTLSLEPKTSNGQGALNHAGFKLSSTSELVALQRRLEMAGLRSEREEGVECCYSKQTKFWLHDPDETLWEMYVLEEDIEHRGSGQRVDRVVGEGASRTGEFVCSEGVEGVGVERVEWLHRLGDSWEIPSSVAMDSADEIGLQGTFNASNAERHMAPFLDQVAERLKPGGRVAIHCLTANHRITEMPPLPGRASVVQSAPCLVDLIDCLALAGFQSIRLTKCAGRPCFTVGDAAFRETMLEAYKPDASRTHSVAVLYSGPAAEIVLDDGTALKRGQSSHISLAVLEQLQGTPLGDTLIVLQDASGACTT